MRRPATTRTPRGYFKRFHRSIRGRYASELFAYTNLSDYTPALLDSGQDWLLIEECTPLTELTLAETVSHKDALWTLLEGLHVNGYWHRDAAVVNVVLHPQRGPLLIDFENLCGASGPISYDLYGAEAVGVCPAWGDNSEGVWWGAEHTPWSPSSWWKDEE